MTTKRSYDDGCAMAQALDLVGERWGLLVVRELVLGPKRFTDLRADLPGISANVLSQRLDELEWAGVARRRKLAPPAGAWVYELTAWGYELEPVIGHLGRWGARSPHLARDAGISVNTLILSLRNMFDASAADGLELSIEIWLADRVFHAEVANGEILVEPGAADEPDGVIEGDPIPLAVVFYDGRTLEDALSDGDLVVKGDREAVERFVTLFSLPEPAPLPA